MQASSLAVGARAHADEGGRPHGAEDVVAQDTELRPFLRPHSFRLSESPASMDALHDQASAPSSESGSWRLSMEPVPGKERDPERVMPHCPRDVPVHGEQRHIGR